MGGRLSCYDAVAAGSVPLIDGGTGNQRRLGGSDKQERPS